MIIIALSFGAGFAAARAGVPLIVALLTFIGTVAALGSLAIGLRVR